MPNTHNIYTFESFIFDVRQRELKSGGQSVDLTAVEYELLLFFLKNPRTPHMYGDLYELILGMDGKSKENTIPTHVSNLRKKLRPHSERNLIKNITNYGYKFVAEVGVGQSSDHSNEAFATGTDSAGAEAGNSEEHLNSPAPAESARDFAERFIAQTADGTSVGGDHLPPRRKETDFSSLSQSARKLTAGIIAAGVIIFVLVFYGYRQGKSTEKKLMDIRLDQAEFISKPSANNQCLMRLTGENIKPEMVSLKVTGPGCGGDAPCTVPNGALRLYGSISEYVIERAPVTLASGEYQIWLENEAGHISNPVTAVVPKAESSAVQIDAR